jgi:hypothetical protein
MVYKDGIFNGMDVLSAKKEATLKMNKGLCIALRFSNENLKAMHCRYILGVRVPYKTLRTRGPKKYM